MRGCASSRRNHPLAARIKRLMQKDDEVGRIASATPTLIARALELFLGKLCTNVIDYAKGKKSRTIAPSHLKAYVLSKSQLDFLKTTVRHVPDLSPAEAAPAVQPNKRIRTQPVEGGPRQKGRGRGDWYGGRTSKRQCVPTPVTSVDTPTISQSIFAALPQSSIEEAAAIDPSSPWNAVGAASLPVLNSSHSESQPMSFLEKQRRVKSVPAMTSAVRTHEIQVDPLTLPIDLQKALLHIPADIPSSGPPCLSMPPVSLALSISDVELGMRSKEMDTPLSIHDLSPSMHFGKGLALLPVQSIAAFKAEEDNYDFSDDDEGPKNVTNA